MKTIRVATRRRFTQVDRQAINDQRLSFKARGVLFWLLDKPDDWETSAERIEQQGTEGRRAIRSALEELETYGYLVRRRWRDSDQKWRTEWTVYENPRSEPPTGSGTPVPVYRNRSVLYKTETKTEKGFSKNETGIARIPLPRPFCTDCDGWLDGEGPPALLCSCG